MKTNGLAPPMPQSMVRWGCGICWGLAGLVALVVLSFWSLDLQLHRLFSSAALERMGRFVLELSRPELSVDFLTKLGLAALAGLVLAFMATDTPDSHPSIVALSRLLLNLLRSVPDLMWAAMLIIASGLGPMAGTLALALHTAGVLGRLFADASENAANHERETLRLAGVRPIHCFLYATLPSIIPQLLSYTLYRWENNIRAAAVLGVVGAGGLGQMLSFHMGLFQMNETSSILIVMILLVVLVDSLSYLTRRILMR